MATTYKLIQKNILTNDTGTITFSNIPQNYTDLMIISSAVGTSGSASQLIISFNGSSSDYTLTGIYGSGTSAIPVNRASYGFNMVGYFSLGSGIPGNTEILISNYSSSSSHKLISSFSVSEAALATTDYMSIISGRWSQNSPINSITIAPYSGAFKSGSSFFLYGISRMDDGSQGYFGPAMTGGDEVYTTGNGYKVHVFRNSGTLNVTAPGEVEYLVLGGGGGGGALGGGGGGGGALISTLRLNIGTYSAAIGAGGSGSPQGVGTATPAIGTSGNSSSLGAISSTGGGCGGTWQNISGANGGSGGGGGADTGLGGAGITGQGNSGANGGGSGTFAGGGGGGAGSSGSTVNTGSGGAGGAGIQVFGSFYASGGGGGCWSGTGGAASAGGGTSGANNGLSASHASPNTGGGGGGGGFTTSLANRFGASGNGGSGIIIIRYRI